MSIPNRGGRPKKVSVELNADSLKSMLQNIWHESEELKTKAVSQYYKQVKQIDEKSDIALISKVNADYLKIANDCVEKKLSVAKIAKEYIQKDAKDDNNSNGNSLNPVITDDAKERIQQMLQNINNPEAQEEYVPKSVTEIDVKENNSLNEILNSNNNDIDDDITNVGF